MDSVLGMLIYEMQAAQFPPERPRQVYEPVKCADGFVMVAAVTKKNLDVLFDVVGFPEGKTDPRFATVATKESNWPVLLEIIERWTSRRSGEECEAVLMKAGVPCSRYRTEGGDGRSADHRARHAHAAGHARRQLPGGQRALQAIGHAHRGAAAAGPAGRTQRGRAARAAGLSAGQIAELRAEGVLGRTA